MSRVRADEATREQLIEIAKDLRRQVRELSDINNGKDFELDALRQQIVLLTEKCVTEEETVETLLKEIDDLRKEPRPSPTGEESRDLAKGDISALEEKIKELTEVNTFYTAIVAQHDSERKEKEIAHKSDNEQDLREKEALIQSLVEQNKVQQKVVEEALRTKHRLTEENAHLRGQLQNLEMEMTYIVRRQSERQKALSMNKLQQSSNSPTNNTPKTKLEPVTPEQEYRWTKPSPHDTGRSQMTVGSPLANLPSRSVEKPSQGSKSFHDIMSLPPIHIRNPDPQEVRLLERVEVYKNYIIQQEDYEKERQKSFDDIERIRADLFTSMNEKLEAQAKEIQRLKSTLKESAVPQKESDGDFISKLSNLMVEEQRNRREYTLEYTNRLFKSFSEFTQTGPSVRNDTPPKEDAVLPSSTVNSDAVPNSTELLASIETKKFDALTHLIALYGKCLEEYNLVVSKCSLPLLSAEDLVDEAELTDLVHLLKTKVTSEPDATPRRAEVAPVMVETLSSCSVPSSEGEEVISCHSEGRRDGLERALDDTEIPPNEEERRDHHSSSDTEKDTERTPSQCVDAQTQSDNVMEEGMTSDTDATYDTAEKKLSDVKELIQSKRNESLAFFKSGDKAAAIRILKEAKALENGLLLELERSLGSSEPLAGETNVASDPPESVSADEEFPGETDIYKESQRLPSPENQGSSEGIRSFQGISEHGSFHHGGEVHESPANTSDSPRDVGLESSPNEEPCAQKDTVPTGSDDPPAEIFNVDLETRPKSFFTELEVEKPSPNLPVNSVSSESDSDGDFVPEFDPFA